MTMFALAIMLTLAGPATAVAQILAVTATGTPDGAVHVPPDGRGAFAVAAMNVGPTRTVYVVTPDAEVCRTDATTGVCADTGFTNHLTGGRGGVVVMPTDRALTFSVFVRADTLICRPSGGAASIEFREELSGGFPTVFFPGRLLFRLFVPVVSP